MNSSLHEPGTHFATLVEHLGAFDERRRQRLAQLYEAPASGAMDIALHWCQRPDIFDRVLYRELGDNQGWDIVSHLVQDHDLEVDMSWLDPAGRRALTDLGILRPRRGRRKPQDFEWIPGAFAAMLARRIEGTRVSLPILLGRSEREAVVALARQHEISTAGSHIELILRISDTFSGPDFVSSLMDRLGHVEWIAAAMMALELGGICYWREIFGYDLDEDLHLDNVVPLMRSDERVEQREVASILLELGVVFKLEDDALEFTLVGLPEELWYGLWTLGNEWLIEWVAHCYHALEEVAVRRPRELALSGAQALMKWLSVEVNQRPVPRKDWVSASFLEAFRRRAPGLEVDWEGVFSLARHSADFRPEARAQTAAGGEGVGLVDLPRPAFGRRLLSAWVADELGGEIDARLGRALGLDQAWQQRLVQILEARQLPVSPWMRCAGVAHVETGAGCLREIGDDDDDRIMNEVVTTHFCIRATKITWLDVLSMLESGQWYTVGQLGDLLHYSAAASLFSLLQYVIESPYSNHYFPLQRPSFLTFPLHTEAFVAWAQDIVRRLLVPAGLAQVDGVEGADGRVWLDTANLRVPSPQDWPEGARAQFIGAVMDDPEMSFEVPDFYGASLRTVSEVSDDDRVPADLPLAALHAACEGREIVEFDGKTFKLAEPSKD